MAFSQTLSRPLHPASVFFPRDIAEFREAYAKAHRGSDTSLVGGFANGNNMFLGGIPETQSAGLRGSAFKNDYDDKFYQYQRLHTDWHEYFIS